MEEAHIQLANLVDMERSDPVFTEVERIISFMRPGFDFSLLERVYRDVQSLFRGEVTEYKKCNTRYHDLRHTMAVLLALARLMDGCAMSGRVLSDKGINLGIVCGLMHDTGYIQERDDPRGTGGKYTLVHIPRSIDYMHRYFARDPVMGPEVPHFGDILYCTGVNVKINEIQFASPEIELLGKMLGTADLLGQMADRQYLERLLFLFREFSEAGVPGFENELDLLRKTVGFHGVTRDRFERDLGGLDRLMLLYFRARHNIDRDLYREAIERNMKYLQHILDNHQGEYALHLRRGSGTRS